MRAMIYNRVCGICVVIGAVFAAAVAAGAEFRLLGKLRPTDEYSDAYGVSADGRTVVGVSRAGNGFEAVRWTGDGAIESLGLGIVSEAFAVSADGSRVVGYDLLQPGSGDPIVWTPQGGATSLGDLPGGGIGGSAHDITPDGSVIVGGSSSNLGNESFRWTATTGMVGLGELRGGDFGNQAIAVSGDGSVVVGNSSPLPFPSFDREAFRWTQATGMVGLGDLPGGAFYSQAYDVSRDGSVIVGRSVTDRPDYFAFRWTESTGMVELPPIADGTPFRRAEGISGDGNVIVGAGSIVWDEFHGSRVLDDLLVEQGVDLAGWRTVVARAASFDGLTIVGSAFKQGVAGVESQAFLVRLNPGTFVPEPQPFVLLVTATVGLLLVFVYRARRRPA